MVSKWMMRRAGRRPAAPVNDVGGGGEKWVRVMTAQRLQSQCRGQQVGRMGAAETDGLLDIRLAGPGEPKTPEEVFDRLRWGGLVACVDPDVHRVAALARQYHESGTFVLEQKPDELWHAPLGLRIAGFTPQAYYFTARKTRLVPPGRVTERFTYDVQLRPDADEPSGYCVRKQVPTAESILERLKARAPKASDAELAGRAKRLAGQILPVFLSREAKIIDTLQSTLPEPMRRRVPRPLRIARDERGLVTRLDMQWLRSGGEPMSQVEFARQAAELLEAVHSRGRTIHLDLRPDNVVISGDGVCFVDFGSAVQLSEDLGKSPLLSSLFGELMRPSHLQSTLGHLLRSGQVNREALAALQGRIDTSVDAFYLAALMVQPHANPELERLIEFDPLGEAAGAIDALAAAVLRPKNPSQSGGKSAGDLRRGLERIARRAAG